MSDYEQAAQRAAEQHLAACQEWMWAEEEGGESLERECPSVGPFCGCDTCIVREILWAAWPHLLALAREEVAAAQEAT